MEDKPYKEGTIKFTWISPNDYNYLNRVMYDTVQEAIDNRKKFVLDERWLIMKLIKTDGNQYEWKLLPYGQYKSYRNGMIVRDNKLLYYGSVLLMIYGGYAIFQKLINK